MEEIGGIMATLNIKNLPDALYKKLQAQAKRERRSIAQEVTWLLSKALNPPRQLSILDLKGLGKEHWQGVEASEHVAKERASWD
jgi:plasmid stability protein